jgi:hypothetical protein
MTNTIGNLDVIHYTGSESLIDFFSEENIIDMRSRFGGRSVDLAVELAYLLRNNSNLAISPIIITTPDSFATPLKINDDINGVTVSCGYHAVLMLGECVIDPLYSDTLVPTNDYFKRVCADNPSAYIVSGESFWYFDNGSPMPVDLHYLMTHKF